MFRFFCLLCLGLALALVMTVMIIEERRGSQEVLTMDVLNSIFQALPDHLEITFEHAKVTGGKINFYFNLKEKKISLRYSLRERPAGSVNLTMYFPQKRIYLRQLTAARRRVTVARINSSSKKQYLPSTLRRDLNGKYGRRLLLYFGRLYSYRAKSDYYLSPDDWLQCLYNHRPPPLHSLLKKVGFVSGAISSALLLLMMVIESFRVEPKKLVKTEGVSNYRPRIKPKPRFRSKSEILASKRAPFKLKEKVIVKQDLSPSPGKTKQRINLKPKGSSGKPRQWSKKKEHKPHTKQPL